MSSANSTSNTVDCAIGNVIPFILAEEVLRYEQKASSNKIKRKGSRGHPCLTNLEIGNIGPYPPTNKIELEAYLNKAETPIIHGTTRKPNIGNTTKCIYSHEGRRLYEI